jgi:transposase
MVRPLSKKKVAFGGRGRPVREAQVAQVRRYLRMRCSSPSARAKWTYRRIAELCGVSHQTVLRIDKREWPLPYHDIMAWQMSRKGAHTLTDEQDLVASGWVGWEVTHLRAVTTARLQWFVLAAFGVRISKSSVSRLAKRMGLSVQVAKLVDLRKVGARAIKSIERHVAHVREVIKDCKPDQVLCIDAIGVPDIPDLNAPKRTLAPVGEYQPMLLRGVTRHKFHSFTGVFMDGTCVDCFVVTTEPAVADAAAHMSPERDGGSVVLLDKKKLPKGTKGTAQGNASTQLYFEYLVRNKYINKGTVVIMDRHKSFMSPDLTCILEDAGATCEYFDPGLGGLENVCDNNIHAFIKQHYYSKLIELQGRVRRAPTPSVRIQLWFDAYNAVSESPINKCVVDVGLGGSRKSPSEVAKHLLGIGFRPHARFAELHRMQRRAFLAWAGAVHYNLRDHTDVEPKLGVGNVTFDGPRWIEYDWRR